jgi:hypothetical protein
MDVPDDERDTQPSAGWSPRLPAQTARLHNTDARQPTSRMGYGCRPATRRLLPPDPVSPGLGACDFDDPVRRRSSLPKSHIPVIAIPAITLSFF